jgi:prepilin-type N-terminal cleavage/methylation domain-containing protein
MVKMKRLKDGQRGFTLIELIIAIAIAAVITGGITAAIMQILTINHRDSNHMIAVRQVQQAGKEVSKDALQAQAVNATLTEGLVALAWQEWGSNETHQVTYSVDDGELWRSESISGKEPTDTRVAQYIDSNQTSFLQDGDAWLFTVTAVVGTESETRIYEIRPRPDSL